MTNKQLAQALRSAASALEHGRRRTARTKVQSVAQALGIEPSPDPAMTPLSMPDSAIEIFDQAISAAESELDNLLGKYPVEAIVSYLEGRLWPSGVTCPDCKGKDRITTRTGGYYRCNACKLDFTVRTGSL